jgi:hypothetical protein
VPRFSLLFVLALALALALALTHSHSRSRSRARSLSVPLSLSLARALSLFWLFLLCLSLSLPRCLGASSSCIHMLTRAWAIVHTDDQHSSSHFAFVLVMAPCIAMFACKHWHMWAFHGTCGRFFACIRLHVCVCPYPHVLLHPSRLSRPFLKPYHLLNCRFLTQCMAGMR